MTSTSAMSSSRKGTGAADSGNNGGFWRKSSSAIPGRPNPSKIVDLRQNLASGGSGVVSSNGGPENSASLKMSRGIGSGSLSENASTFKDFEQSVSDAWDIQDLKSDSHSVPKAAEMVEIHQPSSKPSSTNSD